MQVIVVEIPDPLARHPLCAKVRSRTGLNTWDAAPTLAVLPPSCPSHPAHQFQQQRSTETDYTIGPARTRRPRQGYRADSRAECSNPVRAFPAPIRLGRAPRARPCRAPTRRSRLCRAVAGAARRAGPAGPRRPSGVSRRGKCPTSDHLIRVHFTRNQPHRHPAALQLPVPGTVAAAHAVLGPAASGEGWTSWAYSTGGRAGGPALCLGLGRGWPSFLCLTAGVCAPAQRPGIEPSLQRRTSGMCWTALSRTIAHDAAKYRNIVVC